MTHLPFTLRLWSKDPTSDSTVTFYHTPSLCHFPVLLTSSLLLRLTPSSFCPRKPPSSKGSSTTRSRSESAVLSDPRHKGDPKEGYLSDGPSVRVENFFWSSTGTLQGNRDGSSGGRGKRGHGRGSVIGRVFRSRIREGLFVTLIIVYELFLPQCKDKRISPLRPQTTPAPRKGFQYTTLRGPLGR